LAASRDLSARRWAASAGGRRPLSPRPRGLRARAAAAIAPARTAFAPWGGRWLFTRSSPPPGRAAGPPEGRLQRGPSAGVPDGWAFLDSRLRGNDRAVGLCRLQRRIEICTRLGNQVGAERFLQRGRLHFLHCALFKLGQLERAIRDPDQPIHFQAERLQHLAHFAVFALTNRKGEPDVGALLTIERGFNRAVADAIQSYAVAQTIEPLLCDTP